MVCFSSSMKTGYAAVEVRFVVHSNYVGPIVLRKIQPAISIQVQAVTWEVLSLVSLLAAVQVIQPSSDKKVLSKPSYGFGLNLLLCYFPDGDKYSNPCCEKLVMPGGGMLAISVVYLLISLLWLCVSAMLLIDLLTQRKRVSILTKIWSISTVVVCVLDLCVVILFGVDYAMMSNAKNKKISYEVVYLCDSSHLSVAGFLMSLAARGYLLWCINFATAVWLFKTSTTVVVSRRVSLESDNFDKEPWRPFDSRIRDQDRNNSNPPRTWNTATTVPHQPSNAWDAPRSAPAHTHRGGLAQRMLPQQQSSSYESGVRRSTSVRSTPAPQPLGSLFSQQRPSSHSGERNSMSWHQPQSQMGNHWQQSGGGQRSGARSYDNRGYDGGRGRHAY